MPPLKNHPRYRALPARAWFRFDVMRQLTERHWLSEAPKTCWRCTSHRTFRPSLLASEMAELGVINVGAAGTFVVRKSINQAKLRGEFLRRLPFETEVMVCPAHDVLQLAPAGPFAGEPSGSDIVRFVSVLPKRPRVPPALPVNLPAGENWLVRLVAIRGKFAFGLYRRNMQTIRLLGQIEKHLGGSVTTRSWNTFSNLFEILRTKQQGPHFRAAGLND